MGSRVIAVLGSSGSAAAFLAELVQRHAVSPTHTRTFHQLDNANWTGRVFKPKVPQVPVKVVRVNKSSELAAVDPDIIVANSTGGDKASYRYGKLAEELMPCKFGDAMPVALDRMDMIDRRQLIGIMMREVIAMGSKPDPDGHTADPMVKFNG